MSSYITGLNQTRNPDSRLPLYENKEDFEEFYYENIDKVKEYKEKAEEWIKLQRGVSTETSNE